MKKLLLFPIALLLLTLTGCFKDEDDTQGVINEDIEIENFVYRALNYYYLYKEDTPELANNAFNSEGEKVQFLNSFDSPEGLFDYLLSDQDRFSLLFSDFEVLENLLNGISLNNGMEYGLIRYPDGSDDVFGYVRYVLPDTSADTEGIERGMIFNRINGTQITASNFSSLLNPDVYTIGLATFDGTTITPIDTEITLTKTQVTEDPIHIARTFTVDENKIGYLMYNGFRANFDEQLNNVFGNFAAEGVTDLVLDLRYNGGGSVRTATDLASMITGQFTGEIFYNEFWNEDRQEANASPGLFNNQTRNGTPINSLGLSRVFILTSGSSASASELVINGLSPYIEVVQIGTNTTGKFQASALLYDAPAPNFSKSQASSNHKYVMLPLIFKTANANGVTDFIDGLTPDIQQAEMYDNLGNLGSETEPLLATAINEIAPTRASIPFTRELEQVGSSKNNAIEQIMVVE